MDEDEVFGLPPSTTPALPSISKPPENTVNVKSCVNLRKETVKFLSDSGVLQFSFDCLEPCLVKLKWNAPCVSFFLLLNADSCRNANLSTSPIAFSAGLGQTCEFPIDLSKIQFYPEPEEDVESDAKQQNGAVFSVSIKMSGTSDTGKH